MKFRGGLFPREVVSLYLSVGVEGGPELGNEYLCRLSIFNSLEVLIVEMLAEAQGMTSLLPPSVAIGTESL
jgi:hypothetical protein